MFNSSPGSNLSSYFWPCMRLKIKDSALPCINSGQSSLPSCIDFTYIICIHHCQLSYNWTRIKSVIQTEIPQLQFKIHVSVIQIEISQLQFKISQLQFKISNSNWDISITIKDIFNSKRDISITIKDVCNSKRDIWIWNRDTYQCLSLKVKGHDNSSQLTLWCF